MKSYGAFKRHSRLLFSWIKQDRSIVLFIHTTTVVSSQWFIVVVAAYQHSNWGPHTPPWLGHQEFEVIFCPCGQACWSRKEDEWMGLGIYIKQQLNLHPLMLLNEVPLFPARLKLMVYTQKPPKYTVYSLCSLNQIVTWSVFIPWVILQNFIY